MINKTLKYMSYHSGMKMFTYYNAEENRIKHILPYLKTIKNIDGRTNRITREGLQKEIEEYNKLDDLTRHNKTKKICIKSIIPRKNYWYCDIRTFSTRKIKRMVNI